MRIISGELKGRVLHAPENLPVRPTTDFAKSGLFNILNNYFDYEKLSVLDLFCGTGNISFEFASRGTPHIVSVDAHAGCLKFVRETAERFHLRIATVKSDAFRYIAQNNEQFDLIFADPPFESGDADRLPDLVLGKGILKKDGWLVVEHQSKRELKCQARPFQVRRYGNCTFSIFKAVHE